MKLDLFCMRAFFIYIYYNVIWCGHWIVSNIGSVCVVFHVQQVDDGLRDRFIFKHLITNSKQVLGGIVVFKF